MPNPVTDNYFREQLEYIAAVVKLLDNSNLPDSGPGGCYIQVNLVDEDGNKRGHFSDEIGPDSWYYQPEVFQ